MKKIRLKPKAQLNEQAANSQKLPDKMKNHWSYQSHLQKRSRHHPHKKKNRHLSHPKTNCKLKLHHQTNRKLPQNKQLKTVKL